MTGYGRGFSERGGRRVAVEIRSVNHRFLDLKLRGATLDPAVEEKVRQQVKHFLSRGSLTITTRIDGRGPGTAVRIDGNAARRVYYELRDLADQIGLKTEINLSLVCSQPGVMVSTEADVDEEEVGEAVLEATGAALSDLQEMREREGQSLASDLVERIETLAVLTKELAELAKTAPVDAQRRLQERLDRLLKNNNVQVDEARLAQEVAVVADRLDVTEELVRVGSHLEQLRELMTDTKSIGRRLDFLVQELGREYNTVTSKSQSADIARVVVEVKSELEKIREQVQNVE